MNFFSITGLSLGVLLIILELVLPGGISFSLGVSFIIVSLLYHFEWMSQPSSIFLVWAGLALFMSFVGMWITKQFLSGNKEKVDYKDDLESYGELATACTIIDENGGRIQYCGSTWEAITSNGTIPSGEQVKLVSRLGKTWIVEKHNIYSIT